jgi:hypothetical protein
VEVTIRTGFPRSMTVDEVAQDELSFVDKPRLMALTESFVAEKRISAQDYSASDTHMAWKMKFDRVDSYKAWAEAVVDQGIVLEDVWRSKGYDLKVIIRPA